MRSRRHPAHGVFGSPGRPTIVFLTVCTKDRRRWLATAANHCILVEVWQNATAWHIGRYVIMPDHVHLFAAPGDRELPLENWVRYWKSRFTNTCLDPAQVWQADHWDTRLRSGESYDAKWEYVRQNPVRAGLARDAADWPFQGELNRLTW
jgi:REP element-mobilizing transposase RayT